MRKKGPIWEPAVQRLIVEQYGAGVVIGDILKLPEIAALAPSSYTIREILKANGIRPTWKKKKRNPEYWDRAVVDFIIARRNAGDSLSRIDKQVLTNFPHVAVSRSTVLRILEQNAGRLQIKPEIPAEGEDSITRKIIEMYKNGNLIADIRASGIFGDKLPSTHTIRLILKRNGVPLTGKKGELRRWPEELQRRIAELYQDGMTFTEIKSDPLVAANNPTDYAIRNILKRIGIVTKRGSAYKEPITAARFRRYRDGLLTEKELSILHRHLAQAPESRAKIGDWMGLAQAEALPSAGDSPARARAVREAARNWESFFFWCIDALHGNAVKRSVCLRGVELGKALASLRRSLKENDVEKIRRGWERIAEVMNAMRALHAEVVGAVCESTRIPSFPDAV